MAHNNANVRLENVVVPFVVPPAKTCFVVAQKDTRRFYAEFTNVMGAMRCLFRLKAHGYVTRFRCL